MDDLGASDRPLRGKLNGHATNVLLHSAAREKPISQDAG
jgi:hypothetical protein